MLFNYAMLLKIGSIILYELYKLKTNSNSSELL